jgi:hypothetical protein
VGFRHGTKGGAKYGLQPVRSWMELNRWDCAQLRRLLKRDCEASGVPAAVEDPDAIKRVVALITKSKSDRHDLPHSRR